MNCNWKSTHFLLAFLLAGFSSVIYGQSSSCIPPVAFHQVSKNVDQAGLTWESPGQSNSWTVVWGSASTPPNSMVNQVVVHDTWVVIPLSHRSSNSVAYVKGNCGSNGSTWVGPISIKALAACGGQATASTIERVLCGPQTTVIETSSLSEAIWWKGGKPIHRGSKLALDTVRSNQTYDYTPCSILGDDQLVGPSLHHQFGGYANFASGLNITVVDTILLDSATLKSDGPVRFKVEIWDAHRNYRICQSEELGFDKAGTQRFELNLPLSPGSYYLGLDIKPGTGRLYRSTMPQQYPYILPSLMRIDSASNGSPNHYYYLYDIAAKPLCTGNTGMANVSVAQPGYAGPDQTDTLCLGDSILNLNDLLPAAVSKNGYWLDLLADQNIQVLNLNNVPAGYSYTYTYIQEGTQGCADSANYSIYINNCSIGLNESTHEQFAIYPNPSNGTVHIDLESTEKYSLIATDLHGRELHREASNADNTYHLEHLNNGLYIVELRFDSHSLFTRIQVL